MANTTLPLLTAGAAVQSGDLFITRQGADTVDKKVTAAQIATFIGNGAVDSVNSQTGVVVLDASDIAVDDSGFMVLFGSEVQASIAQIDTLLQWSNVAQPFGWSIVTTDFVEGTVLADYGITNNSVGTSAATTITNSAGTNGQVGIVRSRSGTQAGTGKACAYTIMCNAGSLKTGDILSIGSSGFYVDVAPTGSNDYDIVVSWIGATSSTSYDKTLTTTQNVYFLASLTYTNWQLSYVDDSNVRQLVDTGVPVSMTVPSANAFVTVFVKGASAAANVVRGYIGSTLVANVTGARDFASGTVFGRTPRIELIGAGVLERNIYTDFFMKGLYAPNRY